MSQPIEHGSPNWYHFPTHLLRRQLTVTLKRIKVQTSQAIDQSLVKQLSDYVAEVAILLDPLQSQISILQKWRQFIGENAAADKAILEMYDRAIVAREVHLASFQRLLDQGKNTQALVSNPSETSALGQVQC